MNRNKDQNTPAPSAKDDVSTRRQFLHGAGKLTVQAAGLVTVSQLLWFGYIRAISSCCCQNYSLLCGVI
jgi:hypothetical protein